MTIRTAGLIGDVHAEDTSLEATIDFLSTLGLDVLLCTGDIVDGPADANRCANLLIDAGVHCVRGNHDRWLLEGSMRDVSEATDPSTVSTVLRDYLQSLPVTYAFDATIGGTVLVCHGVGVNDMRRLTPDDYGYALTVNDDLQDLIADGRYDVMIGGHTHRSMVKRYGGLTVINPGTLLRRHEPGFAVADFGERTVQFYTFDTSGSIQPDNVFSMSA